MVADGLTDGLTEKGTAEGEGRAAKLVAEGPDGRSGTLRGGRR